MRWGSSSILALWLLGAPGSISAQPYDLSVSPGSCGSGEAIEARVEQRLRTKPDPGWRFTLTIEQTEDQLTSTIESVSPSGAVESREVSGTRCESLLDAIALIIVVTLDPSFSLSEPSLASLPVPRPSRIEEEVAARPQLPPAEVTQTRPVPSTSSKSLPAVWQFGIGLGAGLRHAIDESVNRELQASAQVQRLERFESRVALDYAHAKGRVESGEARVDFTLKTLRLRTSPWAVPLSRRMVLLPALRFEWGALRGQLDAEDAPVKGGSWVTLGTELLWGWRVADFELNLGPTLDLPIKRDHFLAHDRELHRVWAWDPGGRLVLSYWFHLTPGRN